MSACRAFLEVLLPVSDPGLNLRGPPNRFCTQQVRCGCQQASNLPLRPPACSMRAMYNKVVREGQLVPLFTNCFGERLCMPCTLRTVWSPAVI